MKSKTLILVISLSLNLCQVLGIQVKILPLSTCDNRTQCHFPSTRCNKNFKWCECRPKYPIALIKLSVCLEYRNLGQECLISKQCSQTESSICFNSDGKQIDSVDNKLVNEYFRQLRRNHNFNDNHNNGLGQCKCKKGYKQVAGSRCYRTTFSNMTCEGAFECLDIDLNSHCDKKSKRCYCDPGYVFDNDKSECRIIAKKLGDICQMHFECDNWDQNMECRNLQCFCTKGYDFDIITQRCKPSEHKNRPIDSKYQLCNYGYRWDDQTGECEREWRPYDVRPGDYRFFSVDKLLETIVIVIFCFVTIAFLRFWRYILPQNIISESQTGMFSDFSHTNRVQRRRGSRSNSMSRRGRVIQLRVNLDSPEPENLLNEPFVALPLSVSHSSLPTYESASATVPMIDSHPPPYSDEPPTYEEALTLFQTSKL